MAVMVPDFSIVVDGMQDVTQAIKQQLISLIVDDKEGLEADTLKIKVADRGRMAMPREGAVLSVAMGYVGALINMGAFVVDYTEATPTAITIYAHAANMQDSSKEKHTKAWENISLGDCLASIASANGLRYAVHQKMVAMVIDRADQMNESDMHFLQRIVARFGGVFKIADGYAMIMPVGETTIASGIVLQTITIDPSTLLDYTLKTAGRTKYNGAKAHWYNTQSATTITEIAGSKPYKVSPRTYATKPQALATIKNMMLNNNTRRYNATITIVGNATTRYGMPISVVLRPDIPNLWQAKSVKHELRNNGFRSVIRIIAF